MSAATQDPAHMANGEEAPPQGSSPQGNEGHPCNEGDLKSQDHSQNDTQDKAFNHSDDAEKRIADLESQLKDKESKYVYLYAEFENYKKRAIRERSDLLKFGWESAARDLLQTVDNLERALEHMPATTDKVLVDGLKMVLHQFRATLEKQGLQAVQTSAQVFDPNLHEAVAQESSPEHPDGTIIREHSRGYTLHGRLLRPAQVVVSTGKN